MVSVEGLYSSCGIALKYYLVAKSITLTPPTFQVSDGMNSVSRSWVEVMHYMLVGYPPIWYGHENRSAITVTQENHRVVPVGKYSHKL